MEQLFNPVSEFYSNYTFSSLPITICSNYEEVLAKSKTAKTSSIFYNKTKNVITDKSITIDMTFDTSLNIICILNMNLEEKYM